MHILFFDVANGRIGRLSYLGHSALLLLLFLVVGLGIAVAFGVTGHMLNADFHAAHTTVMAAAGVPFIILMIALIGAFLFVSLNLTAKRVRDIGLPGWPVTICYLFAVGLVAQYLSQSVGHALNSLAFLALLLVPGGALGPRATGMSPATGASSATPPH
jgi:uncharacterized membrane protein YhaH (DUF805 family)